VKKQRGRKRADFSAESRKGEPEVSQQSLATTPLDDTIFAGFGSRRY
jgi:hypothetical protein